MQRFKEGFVINTDPCLLDIRTIHDFLRTTYWAADRTLEEIRESVGNSICFGVYLEDRQIGFARVVSDHVSVSWLGDVFILPEFQGRGLGKWLMACVVSHPAVSRTRCILGTRDAHGLYEKYGFERIELMRRVPDGEIQLGF